MSGPDEQQDGTRQEEEHRQTAGHTIGATDIRADSMTVKDEAWGVEDDQDAGSRESQAGQPGQTYAHSTKVGEEPADTATSAATDALTRTGISKSSGLGTRSTNAEHSPPSHGDEPVQGDTHLVDETARMSLGVQEEIPGAETSQSAKDLDGLDFPPPPPLPPKDDKTISAQKAPMKEDSLVQGLGTEYDEKDVPEDDAITDSRSGAIDASNDSETEIQSIMDQFHEGGQGPGVEEIMSPRLEKTQPVFPPRASSLEPLHAATLGSPGPSLKRTVSRDSYTFTPPKAKAPSISGASISSPHNTQSGSKDPTLSPSPSSTSLFQPPPPSPDPEPVQPFDFHRFLEQLRHRTADPVARFLRSFLLEFGKKQWMVHEQVKIISDFLEFISKKMSLCEVWRTVSDAEFDNAREGMEKLVMNRLYSQTFSPAIPPAPATPAGKRSRAQAQPSQAPGRRGQHQEDVERDDVIAQKIRIYGWIKEEHLDIAPLGDKGRKFLTLAQQELLKINSYRAPRDKIICVLNCCKVIFGCLKNSKGDQSADAFVPLLIYTVLRANPANIVSNVQYITRFRNQDKLGGEAGYYISSLMGVVSFVENLDRTNLTITDEEFERNVEAAVSAITEGHKAEEYEGKTHDPQSQQQAQPSTPSQLHFSEKSTLSRPEVTSRNSMDAERSSPRRTASTRLNPAEASGSSASKDEGDEIPAVSGLLRTIQKPLSTIGRMFSDESPSQSQSSGHRNPALNAQPDLARQLSPGPKLERRGSEETRRRTSPARSRTAERARSAEGKVSAQDAAARKASSELAEAQRIRAQEHRVVVETLQGMFPDLDRDVISDVVRMKEGRVGLAVDACLALSN